MRVWVDAWQMQCCGDAFSPGSRIDWMAREVVDSEFLSAFLPEAEVTTISHAEERHADRDQGLVQVEGEARCIWAVYGAYELSTPSSRTLVPVSASGVLEPRNSATGWEDDSPHDKTFLGYIVEIEAT